MIRRVVRVEGRPLPLAGNDIDTDRIIPARFLKSVSFDGLEQHVFADERKAGGYRGTNRPHPFDDPRYQGASVMIVDQNFGCGSSREHAPQALQRWGIQALVGESFAEIFFGNSVMIGLPCVTAGPADLQAIGARVAANPQAHMTVDLEAGDVHDRRFHVQGRPAGEITGGAPDRSLGHHRSPARQVRRGAGHRRTPAVQRRWLRRQPAFALSRSLS